MNLDKTLYQTIKEISNKNPNNIAYDFLGFKKSYKDFFKDIEKCACYLKDLGIQKGDIISIYLPNIPQALELFFAINKMGAISNFIHPQMPIKSNKSILKKMKPKAVFLLDTMEETLFNLRKNSISDKYILVKISDYLPTRTKYFYKFKEIYQASKISTKNNIEYYNLSNDYYEFLENDNPKEVATILLTGGTTGDPKGVCLSSFNINAAAYQTSLHRSNAEPGDKMLAILPIFHGYGLANCIYTTLIEASEVVLLPYFSEKLFINTIIKKKLNYILGVPTLFSKMKDLLSNKDIDLSFFKGLYCGGSKLDENLLIQINDFLKQKNSNVLLREGYGLTECVGACTLMPKNGYKPNSVGLPYEGVSLKIADIDTNNKLDRNKIGRICIKSDTIMVGYYKEAINNIHIDNGKKWLYTDDLGYIDNDGYLYFTDRLSRMVKILGYEVYPANIEQILNNIDFVLDSCVVASNDKQLKILKAYVVLDNLTNKNQKRQIILKTLKKDLPKWSIPREIIFIDKIPKTLFKKKDYKSLN